MLKNAKIYTLEIKYSLLGVSYHIDGAVCESCDTAQREGGETAGRYHLHGECGHAYPHALKCNHSSLGSQKAHDYIDIWLGYFVAE